MAMAEQVNAFDFFKDEIGAESQARRIQAMQRVKYIAFSLGSTDTVAKLIPFLAEQAKTDLSQDDEFLCRLAEQLAVLTDFVDGCYDEMIPCLEYLASQEETVVRDEAIATLSKVARLAPALVPERLVGVVQRLCTAEWFTPRVSACGLFAVVYPAARESQKVELRKWYCNLCSDETPMVRRTAANKLKAFVAVLDKHSVTADLIPVFLQLAQEDTQDSIRVACVTTAVALLERLFKDCPEDNKAHTLLVITQGADDRSWRVRLAVAKHYARICEHMGPEITINSLLNPFINLLKDSEQEVRVAALGVVAQLAPLLSVDDLHTFLLPQLCQLAHDASQHVRAALTNVVGPVAQVLGRELTQRQLLPLMTELMKDEFSDVRQNASSHVAQVCAVVGPDVLAHSLLRVVKELMLDSQWRIRRCVMDQVPGLATQFGPEIFQSKLEELCLAGLMDNVYVVRETAIESMTKVAVHFGREWCVNHLLPKITNQYSANAGYSSRLTALHALPKLCPVMSAPEIAKEVVPLLVRGMRDPVANVRFTACVMLVEIIKQSGAAAQVPQEALRPTLLHLQQDTDTDVKYYSGIALQSVDGGATIAVR